VYGSRQHWGSAGIGVWSAARSAHVRNVRLHLVQQVAGGFESSMAKFGFRLTGEATHVRHVRLHIVQQVAAGGVLHGDAQVPGRQERLPQVHDVRVLRAQPLVQQLPARWSEYELTGARLAFVSPSWLTAMTAGGSRVIRGCMDSKSVARQAHLLSRHCASNRSGGRVCFRRRTAGCAWSSSCARCAPGT
jgi:hypothetical protein